MALAARSTSPGALAELQTRNLCSVSASPAASSVEIGAAPVHPGCSRRTTALAGTASAPCPREGCIAGAGLAFLLI